VARNRKRAKERRSREPQVVPGAHHDLDLPEDAPEPLAHATPDVDLAEAQLALGRPDLARESAGRSREADDQSDELNEEEYEAEVEASLGDGGRGDGGGATAIAGLEGGGGEAAAPVPARRQSLILRIVGFLQGSWRELQRVQWPDRRQTMQATGVVIGFVIVAAIFLGVADVLSQHLVNYVLEGHW
jgi:preprotein translocase SecE subunit